MKFWEALRHMQEDGWECTYGAGAETYRCTIQGSIIAKSSQQIQESIIDFMLISDWRRVEPPKQKRKVRLYRKRVVGKDWSDWSTSEASMLPDQFFTTEICEVQVRYVEVEE